MYKSNKKDIILDIAVKIFSQKGFNATTTSEIAREAGVAEGTIFRYFKTKKELLLGTMEKFSIFLGEILITDRINKIIEQYNKDDYKGILLAIAKDRMKLVDEHWEVIQVVTNEMQYHKELKNYFLKNVVQKGKVILEEFTQRGIDAGCFRDDVHPTIAAQMIVGNLGMFILQKKLAPQLIKMNDDRQLEMIIDLIFEGLSKKGGEEIE